MNDDLLMELADCGSPEKLISVILKHHTSWVAPIPLEEFATSVNIVDIRELEADGFEGALLTDSAKQQGVILFKVGTQEGRRRFTIAHELGHFLIPTHIGNQQCTAADLRESRRDNAHRRREAEANRFAAGLLMPKPWFCRDMERLGSADISHIETLKTQYGTSFEAAANRYCELSDEACAFIFSKDGVIRYVRPNTSFPRLTLGKGDKLPAQSASARSRLGALRKASEWSEVDGSVWLETERGQRAPNILEQTMYQSGGFQVSLLSIPKEELRDDDDEEQEINKSWEFGFRRR